MKQLSKEEAIKLYDSEWYKDKTDKEICDLQLYQSRLCMPFWIFQRALENMLGEQLTTIAFTDVAFLKRLYEEKIKENKNV